MGSEVYKLRCSLLGHSMDVRGVATGETEGGKEFVLSGSRDKTMKVWLPMEDNVPFTTYQSCEGHTNFVSCVYAIPPNAKHPTGLVLSGGHDHTILAFEIGKLQPIFRLVGHKGTVCSINGTSDSLIVSGSWDMSAKVWADQENVATLTGHQAAVWAVATVPGDQHKILTASADKEIRLWVNYKPSTIFKGHTDCVRALAVVDADNFLSGSNDASIRLWSISRGETVQTYYGHTNFIYSISLLPEGQGFASVGEDRTLRIWRGNQTLGVNCQQVIHHPAISVWSVATLKSGDIVTGSSDGSVRVFTNDPEKKGSPEVVAAFDDEVAKSTIAAQQDLGGMKISELPGPESLLREGKRDGETKMVREGDKVGCYSWSDAEQKWTKVGDVVGASGATQNTSGKVLHEGKEYDYVFTVDLEQGNLKLPYNVTEDPWFAAQKFIHKNELSQLFLDQVANFIINNTKGIQLGVSSESSDYADPFTGGARYVPGSAGGSANSSGGGGGGLDPFTGSGAYTTDAAKPNVSSSSSGLNNSSSGPCFPVQDFLTFSSPPNYDALRMKLLEFTGSMGSAAGFGPEDIDTILDIGKEPSWNESTEAVVQYCLNNWPSDKIFPVLDLLRLGSLNPVFATHLNEKFSLTKTLIEKFMSRETPKNQMLSLRLICNVFGTLSDQLMSEKHIIISSMLSNLVKAKMNEVAGSTLLLNYSVIVSGGGTQNNPAWASVDNQTEVLMAAVSLVEILGEPEAAFRTLVAIGNLISGNPIMASLFKNLAGDSLLKNYRESGALPKIQNCAAQLQATLAEVGV